MNKYYIYMYLKGGEVIYVGQTIRPVSRHCEHRLHSKWFKDHTDYVITEVPNKTSMDVYELYLINTLNPVNNKANARADEFTFELPELSFGDGESFLTTLCEVKPKRKARKPKVEKSNNLEGIQRIINMCTNIEFDNTEDGNVFTLTIMHDIDIPQLFKDSVYNRRQLLSTVESDELLYHELTFVIPFEVFDVFTMFKEAWNSQQMELV